MECKLLALTPDVWTAYCGLCAVRKYPTPSLPPGGVFIGAMHPERGPVLVSGAVHGPMDTRFVLVDHFVTNPTLPLRLRRTAAAMTVRAVQTLATLMGRTTVVHPRASKSLRSFVCKLGFQDDPQAPFHPPGVRVPWLLYQKRKAPGAPLPAEPTPELPVAKVAKKKPGGKRGIRPR
jgi:hypothetical protein